jgi:hypothetical protein
MSTIKAIKRIEEIKLRREKYFYRLRINKAKRELQEKIDNV